MINNVDDRYTSIEQHLINSNNAQYVKRRRERKSEV